MLVKCAVMLPYDEVPSGERGSSLQLANAVAAAIGQQQQQQQLWQQMSADRGVLL